MSTEQTPSAPSVFPGLPAFRHELSAMRDHWWWFLLLGIFLVVMGTFAVGAAAIVGVASVMLFGFLLLAAGIMQIVSAFWTGRWSGLLMHVLIGILYVLTGWLMVERPLESELNLTLLIALFLTAAGIFRIVSSLLIRFHDWGWVLLNGGRDPDAGAAHCQGLAGLGPVGDRHVRGHRHDLQRLGLDHAVDRTSHPEGPGDPGRQLNPALDRRSVVGQATWAPAGGLRRPTEAARFRPLAAILGRGRPLGAA